MAIYVEGRSSPVTTVRGITNYSNYASMNPDQVIAGILLWVGVRMAALHLRNLSKNKEILKRIKALSDKSKFLYLTLNSPVNRKRRDNKRVGNILKSREMDVKTSPSTKKPLFAGLAGDLTWMETLE